MVRLTLVAALLAGTVIAGCITGDDDDPATEPPAGAAAQTTPAGTSTPCPVTVPNGQTPPGEGPDPYHYGNGELWTTLWPEGIVVVEAEDSQDTMIVEWPWWVGVDGELTITGQRLDGQGLPVSFELLGEPDPDGYQPASLSFSNEGCWEVSGQAGGASLTFVTLVARQ